MSDDTAVEDAPAEETVPGEEPIVMPAAELEAALKELENDPNVKMALARLPELSEIEVALHLPEGTVQVNGLALLDPDTPYNTWESIGHVIGFTGRWHRFALGDWLLFGEAVYGEESAQAVESTPSERYDVARRITGLQIETLRNYVRVCQNVPLPIRRVELDFSMHDAVASLDREDQIYFLGEAVDNGWDRSELREAIRARLNPPAEGDGPEVVDPPPVQSPYEQLREAAARVFHQAQPTSDGSVLVPSEPWHALCAALGEE